MIKYISEKLDVRDILLFGGLAMLGYGLYLKWGLWLALIICGFFLVLFSLGWLFRIPKKERE